jgi:predicted MFS family arabinose efflux permease
VGLALSGLAFAAAPTLGWAVAARAFVGFASSLFWIPMLKLCLDLSPGTYGRSVGALISAGNAAAVLSLLLLPFVLQALSWRLVALLAALPLLPMALLPLRFRQPHTTTSGVGARRLDVAALFLLARDVRVWRVAFPAIMWCGTWFGLLTWLPRYARDVLGMPAAASGSLSAAVSLALIPSSFFFGWLVSRRPASRQPSFYSAQVASLAALLLLSLLGDRFGVAPIYPLVFVIGALFGAFFLFMSQLVAELPQEAIGTATGLVNCLTFFPSFVVPWLMGIVLDLVDMPSTSDPLYSSAAFTSAWCVCASFLAVGLAGGASLARWRPSR